MAAGADGATWISSHKMYCNHPGVGQTARIAGANAGAACGRERRVMAARTAHNY